MVHDLAESESAKQQLSLVQEGARVEEIESAQKQVEQAEEGLRIAQTGRELAATARARPSQPMGLFRPGLDGVSWTGPWKR